MRKTILTLSFLFLIAALFWIAVFTLPEKNLRIIACNVGQGDALLITRGNTQILIDGGPGNKVANCLSKNIPFWDRKIELVVLTHPEEDHYHGLLEVFNNFKVLYFLSNEAESGNQSFGVLKNLIEKEEVKLISPQKAKKLKIGLIYLDILWPLEEYLQKGNNNNSVVLLLKYADFEGLFTGDIGPDAIKDLLKAHRLPNLEYIKIPHHGSKNGLTESLLDATNPQVAVISAGKNPWGHPHKEVLDMLSSRNIKTFITKEEGAITIVTNGFTLEKED